MNINRLFLAGNITRNPELSYTPKGIAVCKFGMAINRRWKTETGEAKEEVTFVDVDSFAKTAEAIGQYFTKGKAIFIEGRLKLDQWTDKSSGQKRSKLSVVCESFQFVGSKDDGQAQPRPVVPAPAKPDSTTKPSTVPEEEDVPF